MTGDDFYIFFGSLCCFPIVVGSHCRLCHFVRNAVNFFRLNLLTFCCISFQILTGRRCCAEYAATKRVDFIMEFTVWCPNFFWSESDWHVMSFFQVAKDARQVYCRIIYSEDQKVDRTSNKFVWLIQSAGNLRWSVRHDMVQPGSGVFSSQKRSSLPTSSDLCGYCSAF